MFGSVYLFEIFISVTIAQRQSEDILLTSLYVFDQFCFLTRRLYPKKKLCYLIKSYNKNIKVG